MRKGFLYTAILLYTVSVSFAADANTSFSGDNSDGSRAVPVHLIPLLDEEGDKITPDAEPLLPFSTRQTCGDCHDYEKIRHGWHFNAAEPSVPPGRRGQPWIFVDAASFTQVPLSYRDWAGTFKPEQLGLSAREFIQLFGRQMPGGGIGEIDSDNPDEMTRGFISGKLEINCLACHNADPAHNQAEYGDQIIRQNFRWAAAATSGFASVAGMARHMPNNYDPFMPHPLDDPKLIPPGITYRGDAFDHKNQVFFDIVRKVPAERCYFCHSNFDAGKEKWEADEDVHLAAGLTCVDCHRNGLEHNIIRGYEGESADSKNPLVGLMSCESCHTNGLFGAPIPKHSGFPPAHFDKLTCTACHSGVWPGRETFRTKTARAHGLGTYNVNKLPDVLPHIVYPVFAKQENGKIGPHKLIWPAFFGIWSYSKLVSGDLGRLILIDPEIVRPVIEKVTGNKESATSGDWLSLTAEQIGKALELLKPTEDTTDDVFFDYFYICGGKLYRLDNKGKLVAGENNLAKPYLWPIAHDVRPAAQSLGANKCEDCHSVNSPFLFGDVEVDTPLASERGSIKMIEFQGLNPVYMKLFAISFVFRPYLKVITICASVILGAVLLLYAFKVLAYIIRIFAEAD
ncbi:MAG: hypothetical protein JW947_06220 [Sedimentisphaerales bacterium]|nr:hypothetical protein [Sedimentisphaerales bacterium]